MSKRRLAAPFLAALSVALLSAAGWSASAAPARTSFRIVGILGLSGPYGAVGEDMRKGVELALDERGRTIRGVPIEIVWEDSETKPQIAVQKAGRQIALGADLVFGDIASGVTSALQGVTEQRKVPLLITFSADDALTAPGKARYSFRTGDNTNAAVATTLKYLLGQNRKKLYGMIPDYGAARDSWTLFKARAAQDGLEVVGDDFVPLGNRDFGIAINKILSSGADAVYTNVQGSDAVTFLKQAAQVDLAAKVKIVGTGLVDETLIKAIGAPAVGVGSFARYNWQTDNPDNRAFVQAFRAKYGEVPSGNAGEAYDGMRWFLNVVEASGSWDKDDWVKAFEGAVDANSIEGTKVMNACDHQARQPGLFVEGVETDGKDGAGFTLQVAARVPAAELYKPCP